MTLGALPFTPVLARGSDDAISPAKAGRCRRCGQDLEVVAGNAVQIVRVVWLELS